jgi:hypothetical protein
MLDIVLAYLRTPFITDPRAETIVSSKLREVHMSTRDA